MTEKTVLDLYRREVETTRDQHYFHYTLEGHATLSTEEFFARTASLAVGLEKLGVGRGDRVMLLTDNRPEWHMVDLATIDLGAADVPIYGTLTPAQVAYQVQDSGSRSRQTMPPCWNRMIDRWLSPATNRPASRSIETFSS